MTLAHSPQDEAHTQPGKSKTVADILTAAADLIDKPGAWTQEEYARDSERHGIGWLPRLRADGVCFCTVGAIAASTPTTVRHWGDIEDGPAAQALADHLGIHRDAIPDWNDAPERTQAEVVAALRAAADKARTADSVGTEGALAPVVHPSPTPPELQDTTQPGAQQ